MIRNFRYNLGDFGAKDWVLREQVDHNGFCNMQLIDFAHGKIRFCLSLNHDSFFDCIHLHGVPIDILTDPVLGSNFKPWEVDKQKVNDWIKENQEELLTEAAEVPL